MLHFNTGQRGKRKVNEWNIMTDGFLICYRIPTHRLKSPYETQAEKNKINLHLDSSSWNHRLCKTQEKSQMQSENKRRVTFNKKAVRLTIAFS